MKEHEKLEPLPEIEGCDGPLEHVGLSSRELLNIGSAHATHRLADKAWHEACDAKRIAEVVQNSLKAHLREIVASRRALNKMIAVVNDQSDRIKSLEESLQLMRDWARKKDGQQKDRAGVDSEVKTKEPIKVKEPTNA